MSLEGSRGTGASGIHYRTDIDGLRAIAVLSVVLYHFSHAVLPGGYLGVDMFFVISGFLITSIISREIQQGTFSIVGFYDRRIRRILPALFLLLLSVTLAACAFMLPGDLVGYSKSLLATLAFVANVYFWRDTDYFSRLAEEKPLLHLWSLSVEEQFYILFPLLLSVAARFRKFWGLLAIIFLILGSFSMNYFALIHGGQSPAFFLLPTRAWELGVGALIALIPVKPSRNVWLLEVGGLIGLACIFVGLLNLVSFTRGVPAASLVVIGTGVMIGTGGLAITLAERLLTFRPLVLVGLVSYSLYLWHWPILVFAQYYLTRTLTLFEAVAAFVLMMLCAMASWHFVEQPVRRSVIQIQKIRLGSLVVALFLATVSVCIIRFEGLPERLSPEATIINAAVGSNYRCSVSQFIPLGASRACLMNLPSRSPLEADVVLLGNSHIQMYAPEWESILIERGKKGLLLPLNGCLPTVRFNISADCISSAKINLKEVLELNRVSVVIIGLTWQHDSGLVDSAGKLVENGKNQALLSALDDLVLQLVSAGKKVVLIGPVAVPGWDVASVLSRQLAFKHVSTQPLALPKNVFMNQFGAAIDYFESRNDLVFVRPDLIQCSEVDCKYILDGRSLFSDSDHIAQQELSRFHDLFQKALPVD